MVSTCCGLIAAFAGTLGAFAGPLKASVDLDASSRAQGLGRTDVNLLSYDPGPGNDNTLAVMKGRLGVGASATRTETRDGTTKLIGPGWKLTIAADGTFVHFRRDVPADLKAPPEGISANELVSLGNDAITKLLGDVVTLAPGEEIVPLHVRYQRMWGHDPSKAMPDATRVNASAVTFGRKVGGVPVVGPGSKIVLTFGNDRTLQALEVDWPRLTQIAQKQSLLGADDLWARINTMAKVPISASDPKVHSVECGYFDPGARLRSDSPMQAGCAVRYLSGTPGDLAATGFVTVVPAGRSVVTDMKWPEARQLCEAAGQCPASAPAITSGGKSRR